MAPMTITLCSGVVYSVRISASPLQLDGERVYGLWSWDDRVILIDADVPVQQRREVLVHELHHAWAHHFGIPEDADAAANNAAAFDALCRQIRQYELEHLTAENLIDHSSTDAVEALPIGAECARCGQRFSAQQIAHEPLRRHGKSGRPAIDRGVYCNHCDAVMLWSEAATEAGEPTGVVLGKPHYLRGPAMINWITKHQDISGVFVA
jgi:bacterioferritin-associated ferredoxin